MIIELTLSMVIITGLGKMLHKRKEVMKGRGK
jgi:hypothetical protein